MYPVTLNRGTLRVAAFRGFAPFAWKEGSEARGRDIAFLQRFATSQKLALSVDFHDFDRLWELPVDGRADIAASGISLMPEKRKSTVAWSAPYSEVRRTLLIRQTDQARLRHMGEVKRLAVVACSAAHDHAKETLSASAILSYCDTLERGIDDLLVERIDAVGTGDVSARHHLGQRPGLAMLDVHEVRSPEYIAFAVRSPLLKSLNAFIATRAAEY